MKNINETTSGTPANAVGTSSSASGPIAMFDPLMGAMKRGTKLRQLFPKIPQELKKEEKGDKK
jgi:hypothetical protein